MQCVKTEENSGGGEVLCFLTNGGRCKRRRR